MPWGTEELQPPGCAAPPPHVATAARSMSDPVLSTRNLASFFTWLCSHPGCLGFSSLPASLPPAQLSHFKGNSYRGQEDSRT